MGTSLVNKLKHRIKTNLKKFPSGNSSNFVENPNSELVSVGFGTYGSENLVLHAWNNSTKITIGKYCSIADNVHIFLGGNHDISRISTYPFGSGKNLIGDSPGHPKTNGDINIANDVWIGSHASIMSGVQVGSGAVIAAFAHVVKDVKPYEVVGGNPAKHIKFRFEDEVVEKLLELKWWDWPVERIRSERTFLISSVNQSDWIQKVIKK